MRLDLSSIMKKLFFLIIRLNNFVFFSFLQKQLMKVLPAKTVERCTVTLHHLLVISSTNAIQVKYNLFHISYPAGRQIK